MGFARKSTPEHVCLKAAAERAIEHDRSTHGEDWWKKLKANGRWMNMICAPTRACCGQAPKEAKPVQRVDRVCHARPAVAMSLSFATSSSYSSCWA